MSEILSQSDQAIIDYAESLRDWSTINQLRRNAETMGKSPELLNKLDIQERNVWYKYEVSIY